MVITLELIGLHSRICILKMQRELCHVAKDLNQDLTSLQFKLAMELINVHYQVAHKYNK